jgi:REP element-mobilizing transposase RayT
MLGCCDRRLTFSRLACEALSLPEGVVVLLGFHVIISAYGFWLPNDPRGSWSDFVWAWDLFRYGPASKVDTRASVAYVPHDRELRRAAKRALKYPPVRFTDDQIPVIGEGFALAADEGPYAIHAGAILPDHAHLILGPQERPVGQVVGHLKSKASMALRRAGIHPFESYVDEHDRVPTCWAEDYWKVYIYSEDHMRKAVRYVEENPLKERRPRQIWEWVLPLPF